MLNTRNSIFLITVFLLGATTLQAQGVVQNANGDVRISGNAGTINYVFMERNNDRPNELRVETLDTTRVLRRVNSITLWMPGSFNHVVVNNLPDIPGDFRYDGGNGIDIVSMSVGKSLDGTGDRETWVGGNIDINLAAGNDFFTTKSAKHPSLCGDLRTLGWVSIHTGTGPNVVHATNVCCLNFSIFGFAGNDDFELGPELILGNVEIHGNDGDDEISVAGSGPNSMVLGRLAIIGGDGDDDFFCDNQTFAGPVSVRMGASNSVDRENVSFDSCVFQSDVTITGASGTEDFLFTRCQNDDVLRINGNNGLDFVDLAAHVGIGNVEINLGGGDVDALFVSDSIFVGEWRFEGSSGFDRGETRGSLYSRSPNSYFSGFEAGDMRN